MEEQSMDPPANLLMYLALALVSLLVVLEKKRSAKAREHGLRLPPGPWKLPGIGTLHHLAGDLPHRAMRELARRHGPVMLLRNGEVATVVVSSREAAREVLKTHDPAFAQRPLTATTRALTGGGRDIVFAPYGDRWRQLRRVAVTELLSARRVLSFRPIREQEVAAMLRTCATAAGSRRSVEMRERLAALVADTTARAVLGDRCEDRDAFLRELGRAIELSAGFNPADLWPSSWIAGRLSGTLRRADKCRDTVYGILDGIVKQHLERMGDGEAEAEDLLDVLLKIQKNGGLQIPLDMQDINAILFDIFGAGSDTSSTTLEWAMAELIRNPTVMRRATAEVREVLGAHGTVREEALGELRYLHLVIPETFRLHPPAPLVIRSAGPPKQEPLISNRVLGYDMPPGATVLVNVWALGRDERYWPGDPDAFRPERFFEAAAPAPDFKGADFELLPFGAGRRMCPGMAFGLASVELALASLLFHFDWEAPGVSDPTELDMTETFGISARRKANLLLLRPVLRVPVPGV